MDLLVTARDADWFAGTAIEGLGCSTFNFNFAHPVMSKNWVVVPSHASSEVETKNATTKTHIRLNIQTPITHARRETTLVCLA